MQTKLQTTGKMVTISSWDEEEETKLQEIQHGTTKNLINDDCRSHLVCSGASLLKSLLCTGRSAHKLRSMLL